MSGRQTNKVINSPVVSKRCERFVKYVREKIKKKKNIVNCQTSKTSPDSTSGLKVGGDHYQSTLFDSHV